MNMKFDEFKNLTIKAFDRERNAEADIFFKEEFSTGKELTCLCVNTKQKGVAVVIELNKYYEAFNNSGSSHIGRLSMKFNSIINMMLRKYDESVREIEKNLFKEKSRQAVFKKLKSFDEIKNDIHLSFSHEVAGLESYPFKKYDKPELFDGKVGCILTFFAVINIGNDDTKRVDITNEMIKDWGVTVDDLEKAAIENDLVKQFEGKELEEIMAVYKEGKLKKEKTDYSSDEKKLLTDAGKPQEVTDKAI